MAAAVLPEATGTARAVIPQCRCVLLHNMLVHYTSRIPILIRCTNTRAPVIKCA
jgi:hypothetical protein